MIARQPVPVFKDPGLATSPPLTQAAVDEAQSTLGRVLPAAYLELLEREANGGKLRRALFPHEHPALEGAAHVPYLLGVGGARGVPALEVLKQAWRYPVESSVLLDSQGPRAVLLQYPDGASPDATSDASEPSVVYVDMKHREGPLCVTLAPSFQAFLDGLRDGSPSFDWALAPELTLALAREQVEAIGWTHAGNHYGIHTFTRGELKLRVLGNRERDGDGYACCEYADCPLVAQLHGARELCSPAAEELSAAWGAGALLVNTPHPAAKPAD